MQVQDSLTYLLYVKGDGIKLTKSFKAAGVAGKSVAVANVATSAIDIANGYSDTDEKAKDLGMNVGSVDYVQAQTGGVAIDTAKSVGVGVASTAAVGVIAGTALTIGINHIDHKYNVTGKIKDSWIHFVKD
ncbi:hypothetical protein QN328_04665 [Streptococcus agalactiae]|uniref:hypothetical protein n=1 Tax=Streptococcus agalactiae TaxID=1311 RepID=UPI003979D095